MINESKNIKNESINQITRDNVLALDIAEHCGYYSTHESGTWNFTQRKGKNATEQHKIDYRRRCMRFKAFHCSAKTIRI